MEKSNPPAKAPSILDTQCRDNFIAVALREIVAWQWAESKVNEAQAAAIAVRYANEAMAARVNTAVLNVVVAKGIKVELGAPLPPTPPEPVEGEKPKTIAEIIGEAEPVAELK